MNRLFILILMVCQAEDLCRLEMMATFLRTQMVLLNGIKRIKAGSMIMETCGFHKLDLKRTAVSIGTLKKEERTEDILMYIRVA